jgi:hypothetical protein
MKYRVKLRKRIWLTTDIEVEADSQQDAEDKIEAGGQYYLSDEDYE